MSAILQVKPNQLIFSNLFLFIQAFNFQSNKSKFTIGAYMASLFFDKEDSDLFFDLAEKRFASLD